jgi:hypothetical protein
VYLFQQLKLQLQQQPQPQLLVRNRPTPQHADVPTEEWVR